jgi:uncharacterized RDD family membrane protein YckC
MVDDSVREELKDKISPRPKTAAPERIQFVPDAKPVMFEAKPFVPKTFEPPSVAANGTEAPRIPKPEKPLVLPAADKHLIAAASAAGEKPFVAPAPMRTETMELAVKPTMPTLVEFRTEKATVPEWRLHLQNAVQQRQNRVNTDVQTQTKLVTNGATALKTETRIEPEPVFHENPTVNSALQRIEQSRRRFLVEERCESDLLFTDEPAGKTFPYRIATKDGETLPVPEVKPRPAKINVTLKPKTATSLKTGEKEFDTNKLPKIPAKISSRFEKVIPIPDEETDETKVKLAEAEDVFEEEIELEEIEDLAPFAMRFNAGLFDLIIGAFLSFVVLIPFMIKSESWFTRGGLIAFGVTCAVVMFIYLTTSVALYGRTFGMRIFALEVVDIEGEEYPTIHQAAVSSCVYILSLALGGVGFLTLPFNAEKRAVHDLISGTIVVREM